MPTNTAPEFKNAEARYKAARTDEERLDALEEMGRTLNKHKGTEKLYADIKSRIKELKASLETKGKHKAFAVKVEREGAGQVVLAGAPNAGKSSLLAALTHATPEIADYPFTTHAPVPGMMAFEDAAVQLVDLPPVSAQHAEPWLYGLIRNADAVLLVFDLTALDPTAEIDGVRALLVEHGLPLVGRDGVAPPEPPVGSGPRPAPKRAIFVGTRLDVEGAADMLGLVREAYPAFDVVGVGAGPGTATTGTEPLRRGVFELLDLVRVYSKAPGKDPDRSRPYVLHRGATVGEFAARVHKDFLEKLAFARVWGAGKFEGQRVHREHVVCDGDVIELHL